MEIFGYDQKDIEKNRQIKGADGDIFHTSITFDQNRWIVWADDAFVDMEQTKHGSYVIARSMKWRILEYT